MSAAENGSPLAELAREWDEFGAADPFHAVLTDRARTVDEVFALGRADVERFARGAARHGVDMRGERALDFGCGVGRLTQALAGRFTNVVGVDISSSMIAAATRHNRFPGRVAYVRNTAPDLRLFDDASFDLVLTHIVLQHLPPSQSLRYVGEFVRVLRRGGAAVIQVPIRRRRRRIRYAIQRALPRGVTAALRRFRGGATPGHTMNVVRASRIEAVVERAGAYVAGLDTDDSSGTDFESSVFYIVKQR